MPRIDIGEISLNVEERGSGPAFIFIPGLVVIVIITHDVFQPSSFLRAQMASFSRKILEL